MIMKRGKTVKELARAAGDLLISVRGDGDVAVTGASYDSGAVARGDLFFCIRGRSSDGHEFAPAAVARGAAALVVERPTGARVPEIEVRDSRRSMGRISAAFFGSPADELLVIGITGTSGKTTSVFLVDSILAAAGRKPALIGTVETRAGGIVRPGVRTTPESLDLQRLFSEIRAAGEDAVAMEVTSHALALHRVEGIRFAAAAFTNLSQDHLDFHGGMEEYFQAKLSLFSHDRVERAAVNMDDLYGRRLLEATDVPSVSFGFSADADVRAEDIRLDPDGSKFLLVAGDGEVKVASPLVGRFNVSNCLCAAAVCLQAGIGLEAIETGLIQAPPVPGRLEPVDEGQPFVVLVDYSHKPGSLEDVLLTARGLAEVRAGRVVCVFGCGGDRDRSKRRPMGAVAARLADYVVVTSDNPRSEEPEDIISEILEGFAEERPGGPHAVMVDRAAAIHHAIEEASAGDVVVLAGKGHETSQEFRDRSVPFDDRVVARDALRAAGWEGGR
jgi:UDP-N-acetylmuramoyl-L-alanyl-D-glutamate--2,6-diaminopimelate ligase